MEEVSQDMDDLPIQHLSLNHESILPLQTTDFYLRLLLLLHNVSYSLMQRCLMTTKPVKFPNFTSLAGSPFFIRLPVPANPGHLQHYQLSLAGGDTLPGWMLFRQHTSILAGWALSEDCGAYHLQLSVNGGNCKAHFYLHILNRTEKNPAWDTSEGETSLWASLLLQLNPLSLGVSQRIHLVSTMADHLPLPVSRISLLSGRSSSQQQEKLRVWRQGGLAVKQDVMIHVAELLWHVGCHKEERQTDLAKALEQSEKMERLGSLLGARVLGWRVLCAASEGERRVKRDLHVQKVTAAPEMAFLHPTQVQRSVILSHTDALLFNLEPSSSTALLHFVDVKSTHTQDIKAVISDRQADTLSQMYQSVNPEVYLTTQKIQKTLIFLHSTSVNSLLEPKASSYLPKHASTITHIVHSMLDLESFNTSALLKSCRPHSSDPSLAPHRVTSTVTHEAVDRESLPARLTLRPRQETPICSDSDRALRTDSDSQATESAQGHTVYPQSEDHDSVTVKSALINSPSVSHPLPKESNKDVLPLSLTSKTLQSSNKTPSAHLFPHVSPYLATKLFKVTQCFDIILNLLLAPSGMNQDANSQPAARPVSSSTLTGPLTLPGQTDMEPSLWTSFSEPSVIFTPALPSEQEVFTQHETPASTQESLVASSLMSTLKTFSTFLPPGVAASLQKEQLPGSFSPTRVSWPVSFPPSDPREIPVSLMLRDTSFIEKTVHMQSKHPAIPGKTTPLTINPLTPTHTRLVLGGYSDPSAPSTAQEWDTAPSSHQPLSLEPSFPLCGKSAAHDVNGFNPPSQSVSYEITATHAQDFLTSMLLDEVNLRGSMSLVEYLTSQPTSIPPGELLQGQIESNDTFKTETSNLPLSLSDTPSQGIIIQSTDDLSVSLVSPLLICGTAAVSEEPPTLQILSLSDEMPASLLLTTLQTVGSLSSRGRSSVQTTSSSASFLSSVNLPPDVLLSVPPLTATVGFPFHYTIPPGTFVDPEDGNSDTLSVELQLIDRPPISVGTWLTLEGLELHGLPLEVDLQFAPQDLLLIASDSQGLSTRLSLTLDLIRRTVEPCHIFTLTVQRSLHSMLRHRDRVEVLLRKLAMFFNSSSSHHLSLVSMTSGSTVVSWYNYSLCEMGQIRLIDCHTDHVQRMWLAMCSADGSVRPAFRKAMLPEFPITKVGPVSFRPECFSIKPTPEVSSSNTSTSCISASAALPPTSQHKTQFWIAGVLAALLIVCLLILILLVVAAALYFCRDHRWSRADTIWPAGQLLSLQSRDRTATRPRQPPIFQPEIPPPPLRLWNGLSNEDEWQLSSDYRWETKTF